MMLAVIDPAPYGLFQASQSRSASDRKLKTECFRAWE